MKQPQAGINGTAKLRHAVCHVSVLCRQSDVASDGLPLQRVGPYRSLTLLALNKADDSAKYSSSLASCADAAQRIRQSCVGPIFVLVYALRYHGCASCCCASVKDFCLRTPLGPRLYLKIRTGRQGLHTILRDDLGLATGVRWYN